MVNVDTKERNYKRHRRMSSVFQPEQPPILKRTATTFSRATTHFQRLTNRQVAQAHERSIYPNYLESLDLRDYELPNVQLYCNNKITTTKYNIISFVPKNLIEQFHRLANAYFVLIICMNWIPWFGVYNRYIGMLPVAIVLLLTAIKDLFEDLRRHKSDNEINARFCHVWDRHKDRFRKITWKDIKVGDFVHLSVDEIIPADILLLRSSDLHGIAFVETSNLDGETSLKQRRVPKNVIPFSGEDSGFKPFHFRSTVICEEPNNQIYKMVGRIVYNDSDVDSLSVEDLRFPTVYDGCKIDSLCPENMLLRGCRVRNTTFVEGLVLYTGTDTKTARNNTGPRYKRSSLELATNKFILCCVLILVAMCVFGGVATALWFASFDTTVKDSLIFIYQVSKSPVVEGLIMFAASILNYQVLIPLALYISVEIIKLFQLYFFHIDLDMYDEASDTAMEYKSFNIPEELGQIQYIMSDKTGTLTENVMVFRRCGIAGVEYCQDIPYDLPQDELKVDNVIVSPSLAQKFEEEFYCNQELFDFFLNMAICNTIVVNKQRRMDSIDDSNGQCFGGNLSKSFFHGSPTVYPVNSPTTSAMPLDNIIEEQNEGADGLQKTDEDEEEFQEKYRKKSVTQTLSTPLRKLQSWSSFTKKLALKKRKLSSKSEQSFMNTQAIYEAESPDELALVFAARKYGLKLVRRTLESMTLVTPDRELFHVQILKVLPFDSKRKKMSIIVRMRGEIMLFCKGADSEIYDSLSSQFKESAYGSQVWHNTKSQLEKFSNAGLRTLCLAKRVLTPEEFDEWSFRHSEIESNIELRNREMELQYSMKFIESELTLLGVTAIEDRLQDGVKETIKSLREAGIQIWLLTGDKLATATNIARSCGLFPSNCDIHIIDDDEDVLLACRNVAESTNIKPQCLIFTAKSLQLIKNLTFYRKKRWCCHFSICSTPLPKPALLNLIEQSAAVLCCRMTPSNKAEVVDFAMKTLKGKVLAIGDGANDVPMIQKADVGIGISGQEGMQAVMASDFALARFKFLEKLLLVHGHWSYDRLANTLLFFLYKNAMYVFVIFWCQLFNGFSGETPMDQFYMMVYPIIFTGAQPLFFGSYDQVVDKETLLDNPRLYCVTRKGKLYRSWHFWANIADAIWQSGVIYFTGHLTYWNTDTGYYSFGFFLSTSIFFVNTLHLSIETHCWTVWTFALYSFFIFLHFFYFFLEGAIVTPEWNLKDVPADVAIHSVQTLQFWLAVLLCIGIAIYPRILITSIINCYKPSAVFVEALRRKRKLVNRTNDSDISSIA